MRGGVVGVASDPRAHLARQCSAGSAPVWVPRRCTHSRLVVSPPLLLAGSAIEAPGSAAAALIPSWKPKVVLLCRGRSTLRRLRCTPRGLLLRMCWVWGRYTRPWTRRGRYTGWVRYQLHSVPCRNMHKAAGCAVACATGHVRHCRPGGGRSTGEARGRPGHRSISSAATALRRCSPAGRGLTLCTLT